jgi:hypothetical protein
VLHVILCIHVCLWPCCGLLGGAVCPPCAHAQSLCQRSVRGGLVKGRTGALSDPTRRVPGQCDSGVHVLGAVALS